MCRPAAARADVGENPFCRRLPAAAALWAQRRSDGRNNVSFLRVVGGVYGALFQAACWLALLPFSPAAALLWLAAGVAGWYFYPEPPPVPLAEAGGKGRPEAA